MQLSFEELQYLEKIVPLCSEKTESKDMIRHIFKSLLVAVTMEVFRYETSKKQVPTEPPSFIIPYIGTIKVNYKKTVNDEGKVSANVSFDIDPSEFIKKEVLAIINDEKPPTMDYHIIRLSDKMEEKLEIKDF